MPRINNIRWLIENHPDWIKADFALNEGGGGSLDASGKPAVLGFQAGEKTTANFLIEATNPGGHSSVPRPDNAIYALSDALSRAGRYDFPIRFNEVTRSYFTALAPLTGGAMGAAMTRLVANPADADADAIVSSNARFHSMLRTTCVATLLEGGHAINALPQRAHASINCRMAPGDTADAVQAQLIKAAGDAPVTITPLPPVNPSNPPPPLTDAVYGTAKRVAAKHFPGLPMLPTMSTGATDGRFLIGAGIPTYGVPGSFGDPLGNAHGLNERISVVRLMAERDYLFDLVKAYAGMK
jgi:acetylornithine deacetylase/succinyl-diaminopimelate desuccinylase-like protein